MKSVFNNHFVICNWNRRGPVIVKALKALRTSPIVIVCSDVTDAVANVGMLDNVFILCGDPTDEQTLHQADVAFAQSVLVLASDNLQSSADAQSVKIALLVEKIQVNVYTVVELLNLNNKNHFSWTKVDDLVTDEELAIKLFAQGIKHLAFEAKDLKESIEALKMLEIYHQLVDPHKKQSQLYRVSIPWPIGSEMTFEEIITVGLKHQVLPCALVGNIKHEIKSGSDSATWSSWKSDVWSAPPATLKISELWPNWPDQSFDIGAIVFSNDFKNTIAMQKSLQNFKK